MKLAPVALFAYNRPEHVRLTIEALKQNYLADDTELIIFSDGAANEVVAENVQKVRRFLKSINGFKTIDIIERQRNYGLGNNIIDGVTEVLNQYEKIIVLEDDLQTARFFLQYMNSALDLYQNNTEVISVHGYMYPVKKTLPETFFIRGADCLGWGTWKRGWECFEKNGKVLLERLLQTNQAKAFDYDGTYPFTQMLRQQIEGKNSSWAIRWYASAFLNNLYTLYPARSLVFHTGGDGSGTNAGYDTLRDVILTNTPIILNWSTPQQDEIAYNEFKRFYGKMHRPSFLYRLKRKWMKLNK